MWTFSWEIVGRNKARIPSEAGLPLCLEYLSLQLVDSTQIAVVKSWYEYRRGHALQLEDHKYAVTHTLLEQACFQQNY